MGGPYHLYSQRDRDINFTVPFKKTNLISKLDTWCLYVSNTENWQPHTLSLTECAVLLRYVGALCQITCHSSLHHFTARSGNFFEKPFFFVFVENLFTSRQRSTMFWYISEKTSTVAGRPLVNTSRHLMKRLNRLSVCLYIHSVGGGAVLNPIKAAQWYFMDASFTVGLLFLSLLLQLFPGYSWREMWRQWCTSTT